MPHPSQSLMSRTPAAMIFLIAVQVFCALFFLTDVWSDYVEENGHFTLHLVIESVAAAVLILGVVLETKVVIELFARKARLEESLQTASQAVFEVIESHFDAWALSPAERDVATFLVKGMSISEIAELRGNKDGTIKAHLNAIYRKSGTKNRAELMAAIIDTLVEAKPLPA